MQAATSGGSAAGEGSSVERRRSSPFKTRGHAAAADSSRTSSDLHRSQSHEPRQTPPLFLMSTDHTSPIPVLPESSMDRPSGTSPSARLKPMAPRQLNAADDDNDDVDKKWTTKSPGGTGGRETVVQLGVDNKPQVIVDGGKLISGGVGDSALMAAAGKISPVDGCELGGMSGGGQGDAGCCGGRCCSSRICRSCRYLFGRISFLFHVVVNALSSCHTAWLAGIALAQECVHGLLTEHLGLIKRILFALVLVGFAVYLGFSVWISGLCAIGVIILAAIVLLFQSLRLLKRFCGHRIDTRIIAPVRGVIHTKPCLCLKW